jgi:hypothetical protein
MPPDNSITQLIISIIILIVIIVLLVIVVCGNQQGITSTKYNQNKNNFGQCCTFWKSIWSACDDCTINGINNN